MGIQLHRRPVTANPEPRTLHLEPTPDALPEVVTVLKTREIVAGNKPKLRKLRNLFRKREL